MFSRIKNFIYRHRRKFLVTGVLVGGSILLSRYAHRKFIEWQDKETKDFLERTRKLYQFESTERTCNQTVLSLAVQLKNEISKVLDSDSLLVKLRSIDKDQKVAVWEELKIAAFAKHAALLYCGLMLILLIRVQLNIMAGTSARDINKKTDLSVQESYLSLCQHFIHSGCKDVCKLIERHVKEVCGKLSLKSKLSLNDVDHLFWSVQASISDDEHDPLQNMTKYLFDESNQDTTSSGELKNLFLHTVKILENEKVSTMAESCVGKAFTNTIDNLAEYFVSQDNQPQGETSKGMTNGTLQGNGHLTLPSDVNIPLAKIIPIIHGLSKASHFPGRPTTKTNDGDSWICQYIIMDKICTLGEDVFNSFANSAK